MNLANLQAISSRPPKKKRKLNNGIRITSNHEQDDVCFLEAEQLPDIRLNEEETQSEGENREEESEEEEGKVNGEGTDNGDVHSEEEGEVNDEVRGNEDVDSEEGGEVNGELRDNGDVHSEEEVEGEQRGMDEDDNEEAGDVEGGERGYSNDVEEEDEIRSPLAELPNELLHKIFKSLDIRSLCRIACCSRRFKTLAYDPTLYMSLNLRSFKWCIQEAFAALAGRCGRLRRLDVSVWGGEDIHLEPFMTETGSKLSHLWADYTSISLPDCTNLVGLSLTHTNICNGSDGWSNLPICTHLQTLDVSSSNADQEVILSVLRNSRDLRCLDIRNAHLQSIDLIVTTAAECNLLLEVLKVTGNDSLTARGVDLIAQLVHLQRLHIQYTKSEWFGNSLTNVFQNCKKLTHLNLENCLLTADIVGSLVEHCKQLTHLNLATNYIVNREVCIRILSNMPELKVLCVASCPVKAAELADLREMHPNVLFADE